MKYPTHECPQPLESRTIQTHYEKIGTLHLTTVLIQVIYTDYSYYSIGVHSADGTQVEFRMISDVSRNESEAIDLFRAVSAGGVTPCTLEYVLSDCIGAL